MARRIILRGRARDTDQLKHIRAGWSIFLARAFGIPYSKVELLVSDLPLLFLPQKSLRPDTPEGGLEYTYMWRLLEQLAKQEIHTWTPLAWWLAREVGDVPERVGLILPPTNDARAVALYARALAPFAASALLPVIPSALEQSGEEDLLERDLAALSGLGLVPVSCGWTGRPLVGLPLAELRSELVKSHAFFTAATGARAVVLVPRPNALGVAVDGLVLREARAAGFQRIITEPLQPLRGDDAEGWWRAVRCEQEDPPAQVIAWARDGASRTAQVTRAARVIARRGQKVGARLLGRLRGTSDEDA